jgi:hypothetical protein
VTSGGEADVTYMEIGIPSALSDIAMSFFVPLPLCLVFPTSLPPF